MAAAVDEPVHRERWDLLRRLGRPPLPGGVESNLIVSITITSDAMCRATDKTSRLDTEAARDFLDDFVTLP